MLGLSPAAAYTALFVLTLPICLWVAWSDLSRMKIPNTAVYALLAVFFFAGLAVIPLDTWLWRWVSAVIVLAIGFILFAAAGWGAGDAKFAAAAAPFFAQNILEIQIALILLAVWMLGTLALHRLARSIPAIRRATPDWVSWTRRLHVPVGVALAGTLSTYLALKAFPAFYSLLAGAVGFTST